MIADSQPVAITRERESANRLPLCLPVLLPILNTDFAYGSIPVLLPVLIWRMLGLLLRQGRSSRGAVHSGALYRSPTTAVFAWQETEGRSQSWRGLDDGLLPRSYRGPGTLQVSREDRSDQDKKSKPGTPTREDTASVTRKPRPRQEEQARNSNAIGPVKMIRPGQGRTRRPDTCG